MLVSLFFLHFFFLYDTDHHLLSASVSVSACVCIFFSSGCGFVFSLSSAICRFEFFLFPAAFMNVFTVLYVIG